MPIEPSAPILVTGGHRTGTTWVGKMLAASGEAAYISEPLNANHRPGVLRASTPYWYTYICPDNESQFLPGIAELLSFRYHLADELRSIRSRKDLLRAGRDAGIFLKGRWLRQRPLLKDPFAIFSAAWFAQKLGFQVVVTIRHPAAFASSLKRLDWPFDFKDLLAQPLLRRDGLEPFREEMEAAVAAAATAVKGAQDIVGQASLLWKIIYSMVERQHQQQPGFHIVRHEDLSLDPTAGFRQLYATLGLSFSPRALHTIQNASSSENPGELGRKKVHAVRLDSRANLQNWKRRLSPPEIHQIRSLTEELSQRFYPDFTWEVSTDERIPR